MAAVCVKMFRPSFSLLRLCGSTSTTSLRCLEVTGDSWQYNHSQSFHSSGTTIKKPDFLRPLQDVQSICAVAKESTILNVCDKILRLGGRKRSEWRKDRVPAHTRLRLDKPEKIKVRKAFGGHKKIKGIKIKHGVYVWNSLDVEFECPILNVVHNTANDIFNKNGVMVKGTIVQVDSNPFKTWYTAYYNKEEKTDAANCSLEQLLPYMDTGKLYAKITTRPGQVGACNGYILEGDELQTFLNDRHDLKLSQESRSATNDQTSMLNS